MPTYYIVIPGLENLSAEVDAPDKRHGKTVYLDYLARNGAITYGERGSYRKKIKMDKMEPGETPTSTRLVYSYRTAEPAPVAQEEQYSEMPQAPEYQEIQQEGPAESPDQIQGTYPVQAAPRRTSPMNPVIQHTDAGIYFGDKSLVGRTSPIVELSRSSKGK